MENGSFVGVNTRRGRKYMSVSCEDSSQISPARALREV